MIAFQIPTDCAVDRLDCFDTNAFQQKEKLGDEIDDDHKKKKLSPFTSMNDYACILHTIKSNV